MLNNLVCLSLVYIYYLKIGFDNHVYDRGYSIFAWCLALVILTVIGGVRARLLCCVLRSCDFKSSFWFFLYDVYFCYYFLLLLCSLMVGLSNPFDLSLIFFSCLISIVFFFDKKYAYSYFWDRRVAEFLVVDSPEDFSKRQVEEMILREFFGYFAVFFLFFVFL